MQNSTGTRQNNMLRLGKPGEPSPMARAAVRASRAGQFALPKTPSSDDNVGGGAPLQTPKTSTAGGSEKSDVLLFSGNKGRGTRGRGRGKANQGRGIPLPSESSVQTSESDYEGGGVLLNAGSENSQASSAVPSSILGAGVVSSTRIPISTMLETSTPAPELPIVDKPIDIPRHSSPFGCIGSEKVDKAKTQNSSNGHGKGSKQAFARQFDFNQQVMEMIMHNKTAAPSTNAMKASNAAHATTTPGYMHINDAQGIGSAHQKQPSLSSPLSPEARPGMDTTSAQHRIFRQNVQDKINLRRQAAGLPPSNPVIPTPEGYRSGLTGSVSDGVLLSKLASPPPQSVSPGPSIISSDSSDRMSEQQLVLPEPWLKPKQGYRDLKAFLGGNGTPTVQQITDVNLFPFEPVGQNVVPRGKGVIRFTNVSRLNCTDMTFS